MSSENQYIVSARKYRPSTFQSVVGQKSLTSTLKNAIDSKRLAQAYLFCGPRGVGKTSCARIFAKTINCLHPTASGEACNECESCRSFNEGRSINIVELDAASNNGVDHIRALNDQVRVPPQVGKYRVFIIDEVHMLSVQAFNAFLKTLEEPPSYVIFILATTEKHKVIPTILSRCQIYDFARITVNDIAEHLAYVASQEHIEAEPAALGVIARKADGAMRDALSIFDQVAASSMGTITYKSAIANLNVLDYEYYFRLIDAFLAGDVPQALLIYKEVRDAGFDSLSFLGGLGAHVRDLLVAAAPQTLPLLEVSADIAQKYKEQAAKIKPQWAYKAMEIINFCDLNYRTTTGKQFLVELTLIRLSQLINPNYATESAGAPSLPPLRQPAPAQQLPAGETTSPAPVQSAAPAAPPQPIKKEQGAAQKPVAAIPPVGGKQMPGRNKLRSFSLHQQPAQAAPESKKEIAETPQPVQPVTTTSAAKEVSADDLIQAWLDFANMHREKHILCSAMRANLPSYDATTGKITALVENQVTKDKYDELRPQLIAHLQQATGLTAIDLEIVISEKTDRPKALTNREYYERLLKENPHFAAMIDDLDATFVS